MTSHKWITWVAVGVALAGAFLAFKLFAGPEDQPGPTDAMIRRDGLVRRLKVGDVRLERGDLVGALEAHRESLAIAEGGAAQDPTSETWQRDLAIIHFRISYDLKETGALEEAHTHARACVAIYKRLAEANPRWADELAQMRAYFEELSQEDD